jgi:hypothetical protein
MTAVYATDAPLTDTPTDLLGELCDGCGVANATVTVTLKSGATLTLCGHHYREHEIALATASE